MLPEGTAAPIGIFGGTFDPIHIAHLRMAQEALEACQLGSVRFTPAGQPTHRGMTGAPAADRLEMARLALRPWPQFELDAAEVTSDAPSYTVPTLMRLRAELGPGRPLVLLLGMDAFLGLPTWHRWREVFELAHIAVATRPGHVMDFTQPTTESGLPAGALRDETRDRLSTPEVLSTCPAGLISPFTMTPPDISATAIRAALARGNSPCFLVPDSVLNYIQTHKLYV